LNLLRESDIRWQETDTGLSLLFDVLDIIDVAIANATSPQHLYESVCEAALEAGGFLLTALITFPPGASWASFQAVCGADAETFAKFRISADERRAEGRGLAGTAFRSGETCFSNDFCGDLRTRPWHEAAGKIGAHACAAVPVSLHGRAAAVFIVCSGRREAFAQSGLGLLERIAQKMGRALNGFKADVRAGPARVLQEDGGKYRTIVETMEDAYYEVDLAGNLVFANSALPKMLGYTLGDLHDAARRGDSDRGFQRSVSDRHAETHPGLGACP
jgi:PAS domain-containing protein